MRNQNHLLTMIYQDATAGRPFRQIARRTSKPAVTQSAGARCGQWWRGVADPLFVRFRTGLAIKTIKTTLINQRDITPWNRNHKNHNDH